MRVAVDVDGTLDANPRQMQSIMSALMAAGHIVSVLTGTSNTVATQADFDNKVAYLTSLGCNECWNDMTVIAHTDADLADQKAAWCATNGVDVLIDNTVANVKAANDAGVDLVLVPWASRVKDK